jgi:hypothetical protein
MLIKCNICRRETEQTAVKQKHYAYSLLCPECLFLAKQQKQPAGPEKMILRILHEHLIKHKVVTEKKFVVWKWMPDFRDKKCPVFWAECIFGDFLERRYQVSYLMKENIEIAEKFGAALRNAFDEKQGGFNLFEFDSKHLSFSVTDIFQIKRDEKIPGLIQYCCVVEF